MKAAEPLKMITVQSDLCSVESFLLIVHSHNSCQISFSHSGQLFKHGVDHRKADRHSWRTWFTENRTEQNIYVGPPGWREVFHCQLWLTAPLFSALVLGVVGSEACFVAAVITPRSDDLCTPIHQSGHISSKAGSHQHALPQRNNLRAA